jgi:hypothetical protein
MTPEYIKLITAGCKNSKRWTLPYMEDNCSVRLFGCKQIARRYSYTYNTGNIEYKLRVADIKRRHQKAIRRFCDSSNEGRQTARECSKRITGMIVRPWDISYTMSQLLTDAPHDLPCNISCRKSHCIATGEDRTTVQLPYRVTHCTDLKRRSLLSECHTVSWRTSKWNFICACEKATAFHVLNVRTLTHA